MTRDILIYFILQNSLIEVQVSIKFKAIDLNVIRLFFIDKKLSNFIYQYYHIGYGDKNVKYI